MRCRRTVHRPETFLLVAVQVLGARVAGLHAGFDHGVEQGVVAVLRRGHAQGAAVAVVVIGADVAGLGLAEIRQAVMVGPILQPGPAGPAVIVHRVAADVAHAVDQRGAAQPLAAPALHAPVAHVRLGFGLVGPVVAPPLQREGQRRRHLGAEVEPVVRAAGLEQQHLHVGVLGQARGEHVAGRTGADDDVVVFLLGLHVLSCPLLCLLKTPTRTRRARPGWIWYGYRHAASPARSRAPRPTACSRPPASPPPIRPRC